MCFRFMILMSFMVKRTFREYCGLGALPFALCVVRRALCPRPLALPFRIPHFAFRIRNP
jgi:hypothetical protein